MEQLKSVVWTKRINNTNKIYFPLENAKRWNYRSFFSFFDNGSNVRCTWRNFRSSALLNSSSALKFYTPLAIIIIDIRANGKTELCLTIREMSDKFPLGKYKANARMHTHADTHTLLPGFGFAMSELWWKFNVATLT